MPRAYGTHLYILQAGELIKVGRSMNVPRRLKELRHSNPWGDIELLAEFPCAGCL